MAALVHEGLSYVQLLLTSLDAVGFAGNVIVTKSIESGTARADRGSSCRSPLVARSIRVPTQQHAAPMLQAPAGAIRAQPAS